MVNCLFMKSPEIKKNKFIYHNFKLGLPYFHFSKRDVSYKQILSEEQKNVIVLFSCRFFANVKIFPTNCKWRPEKVIVFFCMPPLTRNMTKTALQFFTCDCPRFSTQKSKVEEFSIIFNTTQKMSLLIYDSWSFKILR